MVKVPKESDCYTCNGCMARLTEANFEPRERCDIYYPGIPKNHFFDKIIDDWREKHDRVNRNPTK